VVEQKTCKSKFSVINSAMIEWMRELDSDTLMLLFVMGGAFYMSMVCAFVILLFARTMKFLVRPLRRKKD
jgi:hypothetical protein